MGRAKLDPINLPKFSLTELAQLDAMTSDEIERNAQGDADNPPLTEAELDRMQTARAVQAVRKARGLSQTAFAETYGIAVARLRDWEQGRFKPDAMARAYLETIRYEPEAVARALKAARR
jgi:putative transcriptional regulator